MNSLNKYKACGWIKGGVAAKLLYLMLDDLADGNGEIVIPQRKISDALHIARSTVSRNLGRLRDGGHIAVQAQHHADGGRAANKYVIR